MKKSLSLLLCLAMLFSLLAACSSTSSTTTADTAEEATTTVEDTTTQVEEEEEEEELPATRTVVDMGGVEVEIPYTVTSYIDSWYAHNAVIVMLDNAEGLVGTACSESGYAWMFYVCENMYNAEYFKFATDMNLEEIIALQPDVIFGSGETYREMFESVGIAYINCKFTTYDTMIQSIRLTAEVLGGDAVEIAEEYIAYLSERLDWVSERIATLDESEKKTVLHGSSVYEYGVDGANTIIDEWITMAGGINVAADDVDGNLSTATMEQILAWDPDVIITGTYGDDELILADTTWSVLTAVQNGEVYCNPKGIFSWDRYGVEEALQFQYAAQLLYPELFEDFDLGEELKYFYETFLNFTLSDEDVELILTHQDPVL